MYLKICLFLNGWESLYYLDQSLILKIDSLFSTDSDIAFPTLAFTDNDSDNQLQTASEVKATAVFQSAVTVSPTIEIPGAGGGQMITSDRLTWYYTWM